MSAAPAALDRYNVVSRELVSLYAERAKLQNAVLEEWQSAYNTATAAGLAYNPAAAQAKSATLHWQIELNKNQGEIDGHLAELRYLDRYLEDTRLREVYRGESD